MYKSITLEDTKRMLSAGEEKAAGLGIAYNIAVVDASGHLVVVVADGEIIGAVGASAGTVEQDIAVAEAAIAALVV
jgi:uncharacterized protein GlcG (DUF336 family)